MEVILHRFPINEKDIFDIEELYCSLLNKKRGGEILDEETLDWMDYANNILQAI